MKCGEQRETFLGIKGMMQKVLRSREFEFKTLGNKWFYSWGTRDKIKND